MDAWRRKRRDLRYQPRAAHAGFAPRWGDTGEAGVLRVAQPNPAPARRLGGLLFAGAARYARQGLSRPWTRTRCNCDFSAPVGWRTSA